MFDTTQQEVRILVDKLKHKIYDIDVMRKTSASNPNYYIEENGRMLGLQEAIEEVVDLQIALEDFHVEWLKEVVDDKKGLENGVLLDKCIALENEVHILRGQIDEYKKLQNRKVEDNERTEENTENNQ
jgi:hypothetical protein